MEQFDDFVARRGLGLLRLAVMLCGNRHDAEDLLQTTFVRLLRNWDKVQSAQLPDAYARKVLVNEHVSWRRRPSRRETVGHSPAEDDTLGGAPLSSDRAGEHDEAWHLLATLPRRQRAVLALRYYEDLSDAQIAGVLDCSESTVRSNAARGLAALRLTHVHRDQEAPR
jgi:RNA polymerase sigma-70 factor (sigma-E family)